MLARKRSSPQRVALDSSDCFGQAGLLGSTLNMFGLDLL
jgi:hypothetical protein